MYWLLKEILEEALDGSLLNAIMNSEVFPYSRGYLGKIKDLNETKIRLKIFRKISSMYPDIKFFDENLISKDTEHLQLPDFNKDIYESLGGGVSPIILHLLKEANDPLSIVDNESKDLKYLLSSFPYSRIPSLKFFGNPDSDILNKHRLEYASDSFILFTACCYIDLEFQNDIENFFNKNVSSEITREYDPSYSYRKYIESRIDKIKEHKKTNKSINMEKLFTILADEFGSDTDSARALIKRWRAGVSTPTPKKLGSFMHTLSDGTLRGLFSEMLLFSMYVSIQLIHKKSESIDPQYRHYLHSCFNIERFSFWVDELRDRYKDVLETRAKEIADEAH